MDYEICANGNLMGEYSGESASNAVDNFSREAGYKNYADMVEQIGGAKDEIEVFEIDGDKLIAAIEAASGQSCFQDSYGGGAVLVNNKSYASYRAAAEEFGIDMSEFVNRTSW